MKKPRSNPMSEALPASWLAVEERLQSAEMVGPRAGFAGRWLARAAAAAPEYRPGRLAWLGLAAGAVLSFSLLAVLVSFWLPLVELPVGSLLANSVLFASNVAVALRVLLTTLSNILSEIPLTVWLMVSTSALAGLMLLAMIVDKVKVFKETK